MSKVKYFINGFVELFRNADNIVSLYKIYAEKVDYLETYI